MAEAWVRHLVAKSCLDRFPRSQRSDIVDADNLYLVYEDVVDTGI